MRVFLHLSALVLCAVALAGFPAPVDAAPGDSSPDRVWREIPRGSAPGGTDAVLSGAFRVYEIDAGALMSILGAAPGDLGVLGTSGAPMLSLPLRDGSFTRYRIAESPVLSPELQAQYPDILSFVGQGVDDPYATVHFVSTPAGFYGFIRNLDGMTYIEPNGVGNTRQSVLYTKADLSRDMQPEMECLVEGDLEDWTPTGAPGAPGEPYQAPPSGDVRTTYEMAVSATGEFTTFFDPGGGTTNTMAQIAASVAAVNAIYLPEVAIQFTVVCSNMYTDPANDPFTNAQSSGTSIDQNAGALDDNCGGNDDYDIGHVFHRRSGGGFSGLAGLGVVCVDDDKARGYSSIGNPVPGNMSWVVDQLCHEIGHQNNAPHTFNSNVSGCDGQRSGSAAIEIGSGSTIMSYAAGSRCSPDLPGTNDAYFHTMSFDNITDYRDGGGACGATANTGNTPPEVNAGSNYTIPRETPFRLTAQGEDADGHALTYCWEQFDQGPPPDQADNPDGPLFRSYPPTPDNMRVVPQMVDILAGNPTPFELLPEVDRNITWRCTVRDNRATGGGVNYDTMQIEVEGDPFFVTYPDGGEEVKAGCDLTVEWEVGGGDVADRVNVLFSSDSGATWESVAENVLNDGSATVALPCVETDQARIMVEAVDNIFFDVSDGDFELVFPELLATAQEDHVYDPPNPWTEDGLVIYYMTVEADCDLHDVTFVAEALQCDVTPCQPGADTKKLGASLVEFVPPRISHLEKDTPTQVEVKITVPVGTSACFYDGTLRVIAGTECDCPPTLEAEVPVSLEVEPETDMDVDDNHGNLSENTLMMVGAKGLLTSGTFTVVNPNSDVKNVDVVDGPGNIRIEPVGTGVEVSDLVKVGDPTVVIPSGDITVTLAQSLNPGEAQEFDFELTVPADSPVGAIYKGSVVVNYESCLGTDPVSDTFGVKLEVVSTMGGLEFADVSPLDSLYFCPPDPWTQVGWAEFEFTVEALGDHRNVRISSGGLRHESMAYKLDEFNFFNQEIAWMPAGTSRDIGTIVKIPVGSPAGTYRGWFTVVSESMGEDSVEVVVEVCPVIDLDIKDAYANLSGNVMEINALSRPQQTGGEWAVRAFDIGLPADWINNHDEFDGPGNAGVDCVECEFDDWSPVWIEDVQHPMLHSNFEFTGTGEVSGDMCDWDSGEFRRIWVSLFVPAMQGPNNHPGTYRGRLDCYAISGSDTTGHDYFDIEVKLAQIVGPGGYDDVVDHGAVAILPVVDGVRIAWGSFAPLGLGGSVDVYRENPDGEFVRINEGPLAQESSFLDTAVDPQARYRYKVLVGPEGRKLTLGPISVGAVPAVPLLAQNSPNPVLGSTQIRFQLPANGDVALKVYDARGRLVRVLHDEFTVAGHHEVDWDRMDDTGRELASGIYFYRLTAPGWSQTKKMVVIR